MKSMTGFGSSVVKIGNKNIVVEIKSVNHKFCEVNLRLSPKFNVLERKIIEEAKIFFSRGRIDISIKDNANDAERNRIKIDAIQIKSYFKQIRQLKGDLKLPGELSLSALLALPNVVCSEEDFNIESYWINLRKALLKGFGELDKMRQREGAALKKEFLRYLLDIEKSIERVKKWIPENIKLHQKKLEERLKKHLPKDTDLDPARLAQEVVFYIDRTDVTEELVRLASHLKHFRHILQSKVPVGRKLDFLLQEMNREVNTLSSKCSSARISQEAVSLKQLVERMREQIQNIE